MHDIPTPTQQKTHSMSYADDLTILSKHPKHETAATQLQDYIHTLKPCLTNNRMKVSTNKSSLTLVKPHNAKYRTQPQVTLNNAPTPPPPPPSHTQHQINWSHIRKRDDVQTTYRRR